MLIEQVYLSEDESSNPLIHHFLAKNVDGLVHNPTIRWRPCGKRVLQLFLTEEVFFLIFITTGHFSTFSCMGYAHRQSGKVVTSWPKVSHSFDEI